jgi:hypothetical protein
MIEDISSPLCTTKLQLFEDELKMDPLPFSLDNYKTILNIYDEATEVIDIIISHDDCLKDTIF